MTVGELGTCPLCGSGNVAVAVADGGKMEGVDWLHGIARCEDCGADQRVMVPVGADRSAAAARARRLVTGTWNEWGRAAR